VRGGTLDRRVVIQRKTSAPSAAGAEVETWSTLATRWAAVRPILGDERTGAEQWVAREQSQFTLRWSADISDLSPLDRIVHPASAAGNSPISERAIYDVISVHQPHRNEDLVVLAARRAA
jgi:head-tail adaptor